MKPTATVVAEALVLTGGNACQIIAARGLGHSPKIPHHLAPLSTMGLHSPQALETVDNIMGHFVGDCVTEAVTIIFGK